VPIYTRTGAHDFLNCFKWSPLDWTIWTQALQIMALKIIAIRTV